MRILHLADLHIGKRVNEFSLLDDQKFILGQILKIAGETKPDVALLAGDLYDRSVPVGEAVGLLDDFLTELAGLGIRVFAVSGNHDSPERLNFGSRLMRKSGVTIAGVFQGGPVYADLSDYFGPVRIHLLPFLKPAMAVPFFGEEACASFESAVRAAVGAAQIAPGARNVLVAHQFVTNCGAEPERCDSETISVGGADNVDVSVFSAFDYVALGHLHGPQKIGRPEVRYAGSPLAYSFSEARQKKSAALVELGEKGKTEVTLLPLMPLHAMREIRGPIAELIAAAPLGNSEDYIHATLTDEREVPDAVGKLRAVYPNLMRIDFEAPGRLQNESHTAAHGDPEQKTPGELFADFFREQMGPAFPNRKNPCWDGR